MKDELIQISGKAYQKCKVVMLPTEKASKLYIAGGILFNYEKEREDGIGNCQNQHLYILSDEEIKEGEDLIKGEWYINTFRGASKPFQNDNLGNNGYLKKIIATTDSEVKIHVGTCFSMEELFKPLPRLSDDFIKAYVKAQGKGFDKVLVETCSNWKNVERGNPDKYLGEKIKVASDNTITIKPFQEVYVSEKALPFVIEALGFNPLEEDFLGKEAIRYCKEKDYEGSAFYNVAMKAIEFGYQLAQKEIESEEKTSWTRSEVIELCKKAMINDEHYDGFRTYLFDKWIKENL
jgi:hypothetical protein